MVTDESIRLVDGVKEAVATLANALDQALARAEKAEAAQDKAILERDRDVAQAESDRDEALVSLMAGACAICATCEGPLTCAKCVPVTEDWTPTLASRLEKLEARVVPVFCSMCGAAYAPGMPPACGHRSGDSADKFEVKP